MSAHKTPFRASARGKENLPSPNIDHKSIRSTNVLPHLSPRTPRRACKDLALARLLAPMEVDSFEFSPPRRSRTTSGVRKTPARRTCVSNLMKPPSSTPRLTAVTSKAPTMDIGSPVRRLRSLSISSEGRPVARNQVRPQISQRAIPRARGHLFRSNDGNRKSSSDSDDTGNSTCTTQSSESEFDSPTDVSDESDSSWTRKSRGPNRPRSTVIGTPTLRRGVSKPERNTPSKQFLTPKRSILPRRTMSVQPSVGRSVANSDRSIHGCLPEREAEFDDIYTFISGKIMNKTGGCMYISGLPGTGKTASVNAVLTTMSDPAVGGDPTAFQKIVVNGMQVSDPQQVYVQILHQLTGKLTSAKHACQQLEREFCGASSRGVPCPNARPIVLVIDELDLLCTRRQDVLYNLFDWPARSARGRGRYLLVVLAIANTMDLPERLLHPRVASRLGMTRLTFAPYSHQQLVQIVRARLMDTVSAVFQDKAIELAARKVAAVSGDVRRVLDICRRAAEIATSSNTKSARSKTNTECVSVNMEHINTALCEMFTTPKLTAIRACSVYEKLFLRALAAEFQARSSEEARLDRCIQQMCALCRLEGFSLPTSSEVFAICSSLGAHKLLLTEASRRDTSMLIRLNCSKADMLFALKQPA
ncbi:Origin recognition complex subunit 1 [Fasciola hepatica]|uniref:Origin recognition complex subunit 1 n=1 Tax=Fasciola hepatica TaxID=6192 RepID=A0A4E0RMK9_FASHE|nr:Origin recognition complex subunit 1 [Fasciola hepatica]